MNRRSLSRLLSLVFAAAAAFAPPISALAHGEVHHHDAASYAASAMHREAALETPAHADGHQHAAFRAELSTKNTPKVVALLVPRLPVVAAVLATKSAPAERKRRSPSGLDHAPPPRLRAPPTLVIG